MTRKLWRNRELFGLRWQARDTDLPGSVSGPRGKHRRRSCSAGALQV